MKVISISTLFRKHRVVKFSYGVLRMTIANMATYGSKISDVILYLKKLFKHWKHWKHIVKH